MRMRRLRALGVQAYRLRETAPASTDAPAAAAEQNAPQASQPTSVQLPCVLVLPKHCPGSALDLVGRAMLAFGAEFARAPRVYAEADGVSGSVPRAQAYLVFGDAQARALGHTLPAEHMRDAEIVLLESPEAWTTGAAKRQAWLALKPLRRCWHGG